MNTVTESDLLMMNALHDAFRRDAVRLTRAAQRWPGDDPAAREALLVGWRQFSNELHHHHTIEDTELWPRMRERLTGSPDALDVLDAMEREHGLLDPVLAEIEAALAEVGSDNRRLGAAIDELVDVLTAHLAHEEREALPLVRRTITTDEWNRVNRQVQRELGLKGAAQTFPWVLDEATPDRAAAMMALLPGPLRLLHRYSWNPRYQKTRRWS